MNRQIGVAADGAGEVGVVRQHQTVVAQGLRGVAGLLHAAQNAGVDGDLDGLAAGLVQQGRQLELRRDGVLELGVQAAGQQRGGQLLHLLGVGGLVHAVDERGLVRAARVGGALVRQQHELLDHALGRAAVTLDNVDAASVLVHDELSLVGLNIHGAAGLAQDQALAVQLVHRGQLVKHGLIFRLEVGQVNTLLGLQQRVDLLVHALDAAADDALDELVAADLAVLVQSHQTGERQAVLALVQRADAVGQLGRQHRDDLVGVVNARRALERFLIQRGAGADIMADVGNVNAQLVAVVQLLQADGVVDVLRLGGVDREDGNAAQVQALRSLGGVNRGVVVGAGLLQHLRRELLADAAAIQDGLGALGRIVGGTEFLDNGGAVVAVAVTAVGDEEADLVAQVHALAPLLGQQELHVAAAVRLHGHAAILGQTDRARKAVVRDRDLDDLALGGTLHARVVEQLDVDLIVGHCAVQRAARDEDVALAVVAAGKAEARGQLDERAGNRVGGCSILIGRKAGHIGAVAHRQLAGGDHSGNGGAQAGVVHLQVVLQFAQRHGTALDRV